MQIEEFKRTLRTFQDAGSDFLVENNQILLSINGETISISVNHNEVGDISVSEGASAVAVPARTWILNRLAKIKSLAQRLIDTIPETRWFIKPSALQLKSLNDDPSENENEVLDAADCLKEELSKPRPLQTTVLYLTGQAGEGKTSLINEVARSQAKEFIAGRCNWVLLPIPLGGRPFLRFDDIVIGVLANKYRFTSLYYDSFLFLVKQGVIVPVFDGFEEVFVSNGASETFSAMGDLLKQFGSQGKVVFSARNAYFEILDFRQQENFMDVIRQSEIDFQRIKLSLWSKRQFLQYCQNRMISDGETIHAKISERLGEQHAILTRAVLVKKLIDLVEFKGFDRDRFVDVIYKSGKDDFSSFVENLLEREANEKWLNDTGKGVYSALLTVQEHGDLLSELALEMWMCREDSISSELVRTVVDIFAEGRNKNAKTHAAIKQRIFDHAFLTVIPNNKERVAFDHEDFKNYFLGEAIARLLIAKNESDVFNALRKGSLPANARRACIKCLDRNSSRMSRTDVLEFLLRITHREGQSSYTHENCNSLIIRLLDGISGKHFLIKKLSFSINNIFRDRNFNGVTFEDCFFMDSSLEGTKFTNVTFLNCVLGTLTFFNDTKIDAVEFNNCQIGAIRAEGKDETYRNPNHIIVILSQLGIVIKDSCIQSDKHVVTDRPHIDIRLVGFEKMLRYFSRSTHIGENIIKIKLGSNARDFIDNCLPCLIKLGVMERYNSSTTSSDPHYRLGVTTSSIDEALKMANGSFDMFISSFKEKRVSSGS